MQGEAAAPAHILRGRAERVKNVVMYLMLVSNQIFLN